MNADLRVADFEQWYVENAFDYAAAPLGSRDCALQRKAWESALAAQPPVCGLPELPMPSYTIGASHDWPVEREFYSAEQTLAYARAYAQQCAAAGGVDGWRGECLEVLRNVDAELSATGRVSQRIRNLIDALRSRP